MSPRHPPHPIYALKFLLSVSNLLYPHGDGTRCSQASHVVNLQLYPLMDQNTERGLVAGIHAREQLRTESIKSRVDVHHVYHMDPQIARYQPLITRKITFTKRLLAPPPRIARRMDFSFVSVTGKRKRSESPPPHHQHLVAPPVRHKRSETPLAPHRRSETPEATSDSTRKQGNIKETDTKKQNTRRAPTPPSLKHVAFDDSLDLDDAMDLQTSDSDNENENEGKVWGPVREVDSEEEPTLIPKPAGEAGRKRSGGYNLQEALQWTDSTYNAVMVSL